MQIRNKRIKELILPHFDNQGVERKGDHIEAYLKVFPDKTYIKFYYNDHDIALAEKHADKDYWEIKAYMEEELKHNPEKSLKDYTQEDLNNLGDAVKDEMKHIWFSADFHQGHRPMAESLWEGIDRPTNMDNHDDWLVNVINGRVGKKDKFFILGDVSMKPKKEAEKFLMKLNGNKTLILGNHDKNLKNTNVIGEITQRKEFKFRRDGIDIFIVLDHYPMISWNRSVHGAWHLYGHVHGRYQHDKMAMDVGLDNVELNHEPINLWEVAEWMVHRRKILSEMLRC